MGEVDDRRGDGGTSGLYGEGFDDSGGESVISAKRRIPTSGGELRPTRRGDKA